MSEVREKRTSFGRLIVLGCALALSFLPNAGSQAAQDHALPINPKTSPDVMIPDADRKPAPDFTLTDSNGRPLHLAAYRGKVVLLNFWATWCGGCKYEMPWFVEFDKQYRAQGLQVIGVSTDDKMETAKAYLEQKHVPYPSVLGDEAFGKRFGLADMPLTLLIDKQGRIAVRHAGVVDRDDFERHVQELLRS